jgi:chemotaxis response regulator CheB
MPVDLITDRLLIQPNRIFIIPEQRDLLVVGGNFHLAPISKPRGWPNVTPSFCDPDGALNGKLIAVIVSAMMAMGRRAMRHKGSGGITIAQRLDTAQQPDMPESAIATGCIDYVLSPEAIAKAIVQIAHATE